MSQITTVPLISLVSSSLNVRKTDCDVETASLAEEIHAHGLKQNLVVVPTEADPDRYEVVAGGRRLRALQILMHDFRLDPNWPVPVLVEQRETGRETSLSENISKIAMNPVDECEAYAAIVDEQTGPREDRIRYCAKRFGVTERHVEQRLRLSSLVDPVREALRAGEMSLEAAKAYGSFSDHDLQLAVFQAESKKTYGVKHDPRSIRDALKSKTYPFNHPQVEYVGLIPYQAAGGRVERELFMGADEGEKIVNPSLLDRLAREKATAELEVAVKRDGFKAGLLTPAFVTYPAWPKPPEGFTRAYQAPWQELTKKERSKAIGLYNLKADGTALECIGYFRPEEAKTSTRQVGETVEQREARRREERIAFRAALLAVTAAPAPTLLEKLILPDAQEYWEFQREEDGTVLIEVLVRVTLDELDAMRAAAEEKEKEEAEAKAAAEAAADAAAEAEEDAAETANG